MLVIIMDLEFFSWEVPSGRHGEVGVNFIGNGC